VPGRKEIRRGTLDIGQPPNMASWPSHQSDVDADATWQAGGNIEAEHGFVRNISGVLRRGRGVRLPRGKRAYHAA